MHAFDMHMPDLNIQFNDAIQLLNTPSEFEFVNNLYPKCKSISIDYAIMEKADNVHVICADFGWSDLGTWGSLYTHITKDDNANGTIGTNAYLFNSSNCIVNISKDKLAIIQGLDGFIVVESDGMILICKKDEEQRIKDFVNEVRIKRGEDFI
jgi:mannose-1-phosphate guanylyltransferase